MSGKKCGGGTLRGALFYLPPKIKIEKSKRKFQIIKLLFCVEKIFLVMYNLEKKYESIT